MTKPFLRLHVWQPCRRWHMKPSNSRGHLGCRCFQPRRHPSSVTFLTGPVFVRNNNKGFRHLVPSLNQTQARGTGRKHYKWGIVYANATYSRVCQWISTTLEPSSCQCVVFDNIPRTYFFFRLWFWEADAIPDHDIFVHDCHPIIQDQRTAFDRRLKWKLRGMRPVQFCATVSLPF